MKTLTVLLFTIFALICPRVSPAEDISFVRSEGIISKAEDKADVKKKALDQALKNAVSQSLDNLLKQEAVEADPNSIKAAVLSNPRSFILNYKILSEGWITHLESAPPVPVDLPESQSAVGIELFHIWIEATVDNGQLRAYLSKMNYLRADDRASVFTLSLIDITDYKTFKSVLSSLKRVSNITDLTYDSFLGGRIVMSAKVKGDPQALTEKISKEMGDSFAVIPAGPNTVVIKAAPKTTTLE